MSKKRLADTLEKDENGRVIRPILKPMKDDNGRAIVTPEMREMAEALTHPEGDPYLNGRDLGFYCEQCG